jgi:hypothetical protein
MKAADPREADDLGGRLGLRFDWTPEWRVFAESEVRSVPVVVGEVLAEQAPEMQVIENNDVVEQFAPYRPHKALRHPVGESCRMHQMGADRRDVSV